MKQEFRYVITKRQYRNFNPKHWAHELHFQISNDRVVELREFLNEVVGIQNYKGLEDRKFLPPEHSREAFIPITLRFVEPQYAMRVKLMWDMCEIPHSQLAAAFIPLVRRVMPHVIANSIVGVSPMVGPTVSIFKLRARYPGTMAGGNTLLYDPTANYRFRGPGYCPHGRSAAASLLPKWKRRKKKRVARL